MRTPFIVLFAMTALLVACEAAPQQGERADEDWIRAVTSGCTGAGCAAQSDEKSAKKEATALASTATGARARAEADALSAAQARAASQLRIPDCPTGCKSAGAPVISYQTTSTHCFQGTAASDPAWWKYACLTMDGRSVHWDCDNSASLPGLSFWAYCEVEVKAKGVQACAPRTCSCAEVGLVGDASCAEILELPED